MGGYWDISLALPGVRSTFGLLNQNFFASRAPSSATSRKSNQRAMHQCPLPAID
jgi:hypothetical protein